MSSTHATENCHIKIDCDKRTATKKPPSTGSTATTSNSNGQLRHITEEVFEDASDVAPRDTLLMSLTILMKLSYYTLPEYLNIIYA